MAPRVVLFTPRARKDIAKLARDIQENILEDLEAISTTVNPLASAKVKKLKGQKGYYRLRTGDFRAIFKLTSEGIQVLRVFDRKDFEKILSQLWS